MWCMQHIPLQMSRLSMLSTELWVSENYRNPARPIISVVAIHWRALFPYQLIGTVVRKTAVLIAAMDINTTRTPSEASQPVITHTQIQATRDLTADTVTMSSTDSYDRGVSFEVSGTAGRVTDLLMTVQ